LPDGVRGNTFLNIAAGSPANVIGSARSVGSVLGDTPPRRGSFASIASSISSASLAVKMGPSNPNRAASRRKISVFGSDSPRGGITAVARWSQCCP
jgi:hypothetical protein